MNLKIVFDRSVNSLIWTTSTKEISYFVGMYKTIKKFNVLFFEIETNILFNSRSFLDRKQEIIF